MFSNDPQADPVKQPSLPDHKPRFARRIANLFGSAGPKLLQDLLSLVFGQFTSMVLGFVAFSYLARRLTTELYGTLEFTVSLAAFAAIVIECGVGMIAVREMARENANPSRIATAAVVARGVIAAVVAPLVALGAYAADLPAPATGLLLLYAVSLLLGPLKQEWLLQSREHMRLAAVAQPLRGAAFAAIVIATVASSHDVIWVGIAELAAAALMTAYYVATQRALGVPFRWREISGRTLYYLREGLSIGLSNMLWAFMLYAPMFLLVALVQDAQATAWLGASQRLVIAMVTSSFLYHFNLYPVITRTVRQDPERWQRITRSSVHLVAWGSCGVALVCASLGSEIMALISGARFAAAGPVLAVLVWAFPLRFLSGHARWSLIADGQQRWLLGAEIAGAAALVLTALLVIPAYGAVGASIALLAGIAVSGAVTQIRAEMTLGTCGFASNVLPAAVAAPAALVIAQQLQADPMTQTGAALILYLLPMLFRFGRLKTDLHRISYAKAD